MTSDSHTEHPFALTSDERTLFRKPSWRLWVVGLGLCNLGAATSFLMIMASEAQRQDTNLVPIAVFAAFFYCTNALRRVESHPRNTITTRRA